MNLQCKLEICVSGCACLWINFVAGLFNLCFFLCPFNIHHVCIAHIRGRRKSNQQLRIHNTRNESSHLTFNQHNNNTKQLSVSICTECVVSSRRSTWFVSALSLFRMQSLSSSSSFKSHMFTSLSVTTTHRLHILICKHCATNWLHTNCTSPLHTNIHAHIREKHLTICTCTQTQNTCKFDQLREQLKPDDDGIYLKYIYIYIYIAKIQFFLYGQTHYDADRGEKENLALTMIMMMDDTTHIVGGGQIDVLFKEREGGQTSRRLFFAVQIF